MRGGFHLAEKVLSEPGIRDARHYARRVGWLAVVHPTLCLASLVGFVLLVWRGELFVTLTQRSNVETLTIAFFLVFFAYFTVITAPGALGGLRILGLRAQHRFAADHVAFERRKQQQLGDRREGPCVALDKQLELEGHPGEPFEIDIGDDGGLFCHLRCDGVCVQQLDTFRNGSNNLFAYVVRGLAKRTRGELTIVQWSSTDDQNLAQYTAMASALRASWPKLVVTRELLGDFERELAALCPALREEVLLPDWEFEGEHKLPIIPEPLGIVSLSRNERRVDPLASLVAALVVVAVVLALIAYFIARPPWVPGH